MTGTNCDLFTHNQSRSYLNHLVLCMTEEPWKFLPARWRTSQFFCSRACRRYWASAKPRTVLWWSGPQDLRIWHLVISFYGYTLRVQCMCHLSQETSTNWNDAFWTHLRLFQRRRLNESGKRRTVEGARMESLQITTHTFTVPLSDKVYSVVLSNSHSKVCIYESFVCENSVNGCHTRGDPKITGINRIFFKMVY